MFALLPLDANDNGTNFALIGIIVWVIVVIAQAVLFIASDASRYALHRAMHTLPALWRFHQVHHSAEVMTPT